MFKHALVVVALAVSLMFAIPYIDSLQNNLELEIAQQKKEITYLENNLADLQYEAHLDALDQNSLTQAQQTLEDQYATLEAEYTAFKSDESQQKLIKIDGIYSMYQSILSKNARNQDVGLDTSITDNTYNDWGLKLINEELDELTTTLTTKNSELESQYTDYIATLPTPTPVPAVAPVVSTPAAGYSYQTVSNSRGTFGVYLIKMSLSEVQVRTVTANSDDCTDNCPAKSLADYVSETGAYAGMHGTYFCPPDYSSCAGKTYSYDFGVYNSYLGKWLNQHALSWNNLGTYTFNGNSASFFEDSKGYGGGAVTAGISNFPSLLKNGNIVVNPDQLTSYQRDVRGSRGAIGTDGQYVYLATMTGASVVDAAYVMQSLGATDALNLDGGGSSAMYIGGQYVVGPGRLLPNAILLVR